MVQKISWKEKERKAEFQVSENVSNSSTGFWETEWSRESATKNSRRMEAICKAQRTKWYENNPLLRQKQYFPSALSKCTPTTQVLFHIRL